jgi:quercetin dioxygenase-like cupin family protein
MKLIDFKNMSWESPAAGIRYKSFIKGAQKIRLVEFTEEFRERDWCIKGHVGYILEGSMSIDFDGELIRYGAGDGIFIEEGSRHKAKVDKGEKALIVLFETEKR